MDALKVRIHNKDEDAWAELGAILVGLSKLAVAFVFLAPLVAGLFGVGVFLFRQNLHPVFCIVGTTLIAVAVWYVFHTLRWLIMAYGTLYTASAAGLIYIELRTSSDPIWAIAGAVTLAGFGLALSWSAYKRHGLARGWAF